MKNLKKYIKKSQLNEDFKQELIECIDEIIETDNEIKLGTCDPIFKNDEFIIHLDVCLEFLESLGFEVEDLSPADDKKLENYLQLYLYTSIPLFPHEITTEDYVTIFKPNVRYNFTSHELPVQVYDV